MRPSPPRFHQRRSGPFRRLGALIAMASVLAACGVTDDGYTYVSNQQEGAFFKVPDEWGRFRVKEDLTPDRPTPMQRGMPWKMIIDGAAKPQRKHFDIVFPTAPVGTAEVIDLSPAGQEQMNDALLRSQVLDSFTDGDPLDPVDMWRRGSKDIEIVSYTRFANKGGVWGSKIIVNVRLSGNDGDEGEWLTIAQKAYVDRSNSKVFRLVLKCKATCYKTQRRELDQVLNSLQLKP